MSSVGKIKQFHWQISQFQRQDAGKDSPAVADKESPAVADNEQIPTNSDYEEYAGETMSQASSQRTPPASGAPSNYSWPDYCRTCRKRPGVGVVGIVNIDQTKTFGKEQ